jgi:hypothetical protein
MTHIADRLERRFGLGTNPQARQALYRRLAEAVDDIGEPAYQVVASAAADSLGKDDPGRYFARVVTLRMYERRLWLHPEL